MSTFKFAGVSTLNGKIKTRFANDQMRVKVLAKNGHEDITMIELPTAMSKLEAAKFIQSLDEFQGVAEQVAIADYLEANADKPVKATKNKKPAVETVESTVAEDPTLEDAPF